jgi:hypothetical protein
MIVQLDYLTIRPKLETGVVVDSVSQLKLVFERTIGLKPR